METNLPSQAPSVPKTLADIIQFNKEKERRRKEKKEEKKRKTAKVLEQIDAVLGPNENGESARERVKRFNEIVKTKMATEQEQILEETSNILEQTRDLEDANDKDLVPPEYWKKVKSLEESAKKKH